MIVAGDGELKEELTKLSHELSVDELVDFVGNLRRDELFQLYKSGAVDIFVLPSVDLGGGLHEGVPVSLMEAMSFGIPVVSTKTGSIEELILPEVNLTVNDKSANDLAALIESLIKDSQAYSALSKWCYSRIEDHFVFDKNVEKIISEIELRKI